MEESERLFLLFEIKFFQKMFRSRKFKANLFMKIIPALCVFAILSLESDMNVLNVKNFLCANDASQCMNIIIT